MLEHIQTNLHSVVDQVSEHWKNMENRTGHSTRILEERHESMRDTDTSDDTGDFHLSQSNRDIVVNALKDMGLDNLAIEYSTKYSRR